jgi:hypothetical protein
VNEGERTTVTLQQIAVSMGMDGGGHNDAEVESADPKWVREHY